MKQLLITGLVPRLASHASGLRHSRIRRQCVGLLVVLAPLKVAFAQTTTFSYLGDTQNYTVPAEVTRIQVVATGASGGRNDAITAYSLGAQVTATLSVTPGEILFVVVGGQGAGGIPFNAGGFNSGGSGSGYAGGGGGATELRRARTFNATDDYLSGRNALVVAGAGGGSDGGGAVGGAGGNPDGGNGIANNVGIGGGATQTGAGGMGSLAGMNGQGGNGNLGGGGGGGYYGGGGGAPTNGSAGGGGGSSWVTSIGRYAVSYGQATTVGNGSLTITAVPDPLPVRLSAFTAEVAGPSAVRLYWATATETNSARFEVERSADGLVFKQIGQVPAAGTSTRAHPYTLIDAALPTGATQLYYRLRQVDIDDAATYSPVRSVTLPTPSLTLYPNPARHAATLSGVAPGSLVQVYDARGSLVLTTQASKAGTAELVLLARLSGGLYLVRSRSGPVVRLAVE